ncbi:hypothetical protein CA606_07300 [Caulobacter vibrioides]|uniref:Uncharacterized protein n=1 Tax=Caulobacter vibrioides TaxID=155892 RepID=A0A290MJD9_CAUVI|nr:terpene cyclase/mutase family protein [Caulobacter vibrioides]ATC32174.1 hypothetical protein CA606_07300 [Caulobacter vibrioides]
MFNLIVSGNGETWEGSSLTFSLDRFGEYAGEEGGSIDINTAEGLQALETMPTLLMYEVGASGPNVRTVRHGRLRNIVRRGGVLNFTFQPDAQHAYLPRADVLLAATELHIEPFEQHRTHWAIKDGDIPIDVLARGAPELPQRTVAVVAAQYAEALEEGTRREVRELEAELEEFPPSLERALAFVPSRLLEKATPEFYPILGVEPRTAEGRRAVEAVLARHSDERPSIEWWFSLAWFLDLYGSRTEAVTLRAAESECASYLASLSSAPPGSLPAEHLAYPLWRAARSRGLATRLRREVAMVLDRLARMQDAQGYWMDAVDGATPDLRATALATVALQRLGDDRYHDATERAVDWLVEQVQAESGAFPRHPGEAPDIVATLVSLEAVHRAGAAEDIAHVVNAAETWLMSAQTARGGWAAEGWPDDLLAACVVDYISSRREMLPQVDGFFLMARDFMRKAEDWALEGGANNRRLAAIASVHAVEMFLYGVFERRDDLALSAFRENGQETLGVREALRALQDALQRIGTLRAPARLPHRDNLSSLVGRRDGIIHRAHEISATELADGMSHARRFIERYGKELLDLNILQ